MPDDRSDVEGLPPVKDRAVGATVYLLPEDHRRLKMLAASEDTTLQSLFMDGIDLILQMREEAVVTRWAPRRKPR